jgi:nucleolar complex protein 3
LSDDDADLLDHGASLGFLANLPKAAMDKEVSVSRIKEKKALKKQKNAREAQQLDNVNGGAGGMSKKALKAAARAAKGDADNEDDEEGEEWERGPRRHASSKVDTDLTAAPLPIKTLQGEIITHPDKALTGPGPAPIKSLSIAGITVQDDLEDVLREKALERQRRAAQAAAEVARREEADRRAAAEKARQEREAAGGLGSLKDYDSIEQRREAAKQAMAVAAQALLGEPEAQISKQLRVLLGLLSDEDTQVSRLAMLTLLAVLKDLIPGYKIRSAAERKQEGVEISKEVKKLWDYETALLKGYQHYLKSLLAVLNAARSGHATPAHGRVAARCLAGLLVAAPHFNYSSDLLQAVVPNMVNTDEQIREHCCGAVALLLRSALNSAEAGQAAVEAVQLVADLIKRRKCIAPREVVDALLELSFPEILSGEDFFAARLARKKKKKKDKKKDEVDKGFKEAQAVVDRDTRRHQQSTILEALFEIFFRVLKTATASGLVSNISVEDGEEEGREGGADASYTPPLPASRFAKRFPLLAPTMEGLSKFSHLISIDYFQDLMAALEELLGSSALPPAQRLRCLLTASEILRGQGESLTIDRKIFYNHLYSALNQVAMTPLIEEDFLFEANNILLDENAEEVPPTAAEAAAALSQHAAFVSDTSQVPTLLAKLLESMLLDSKLLDATRQAAFAKRAAGTAGAAGDTGVAMGLVCVLHRIMRRQSKLRNMLENEAGGPSGYKAYRPELPDPAEAGALSVPLWELSVLAKHYHPHISQAAKDISVMNVAAAHAAAGRSSGGGNVGSSSVLPLGTSAVELSAQYSTAKGGFRPPPKIPASWGPQQAQQASQSKAGRARAAAQRKAADDPLALANLLQKLEEAGGASMDDILPETEAEEEKHAANALSRHYSLNRRFQKNHDLRNEHALLATKLRMFHEHLQKKGKKGDQIEKKKAKKEKKAKTENKERKEKKQKRK